MSCFWETVDMKLEIFYLACAELPLIKSHSAGLGDVAMADGAPIAPTEVLKVGFLNENTQALRKKYEAVYDVLILHDGDFEVPNLLLKEVAEGGDLGRIANVGNGLWRVVEPKL
eukprot:SAG31_NODE_735_length_12488_cov_7.086044_13_plen_114_part_00